MALQDGLQGLKSLCENSFLPQFIERGISSSTMHCGHSLQRVSLHTHSEAQRIKKLIVAAKAATYKSN